MVYVYVECNLPTRLKVNPEKCDRKLTFAGKFNYAVFEVVKHLQEQHRSADRRVLWLKKLYLQLYSECERESSSTEEGRASGPRPFDALQAFGGRVERWRGLGLCLTHCFRFSSLQLPHNTLNGF